MQNNNLICPLSNEWVNSNQVRITAAFICISALLAFIFFNPFIISLLAFDFFNRGFLKKPISFVNRISGRVVAAFDISYKKENKAPKQFAAKIGFVITVLAVVFYCLNFPVLFLGLTGVLILFSFLESAFSFCAGCVVYTLLVKAKLISIN
jgi:hypothetical protein